MEACFNTPHKKFQDSLLLGTTSPPSRSRHAHALNDSPGTPSGTEDRYIGARSAQDNSLSNFLLTSKENMTPVMLLSHASPSSDPTTSPVLLASSPLHLATAATAARSHRRHARRRATHGRSPRPITTATTTAAAAAALLRSSPPTSRGAMAAWMGSPYYAAAAASSTASAASVSPVSALPSRPGSGGMTRHRRRHHHHRPATLVDVLARVGRDGSAGAAGWVSPSPPPLLFGPRRSGSAYDAHDDDDASGGGGVPGGDDGLPNAHVYSRSNSHPVSSSNNSRSSGSSSSSSNSSSNHGSVGGMLNHPRHHPHRESPYSVSRYAGAGLCGGGYAALDMEPYTTKLARMLFSDAPQTSVLGLHNYRAAGVTPMTGVGAGDGAPLRLTDDPSRPPPALWWGHTAAAAAHLPPREAERFNNSVGVVYEQNRACNFTSSHFRIIAQTPERILDAADLIDDFYLNLIDWSVTNMLCVALQSVVYLWEAATCNITRLPSTRTTTSTSTSSSNNNNSTTRHTHSSHGMLSGTHAGGANHSPGAVVVCSVQWAADGRHLAIGYHDGVVEVWDVTVPQVVRRWSKHRARVGCLSWCGASSHTSLLASGSKDASVRVQDVREPDHSTSRSGGGCVTVLRGHTQEVCGLRWSPTGVYLASGGNDNQLLVWDRRTLVTQGGGGGSAEGGEGGYEGELGMEDGSPRGHGDDVAQAVPWWGSQRGVWRDATVTRGAEVIQDYYDRPPRYPLRHRPPRHMYATRHREEDEETYEREDAEEDALGDVSDADADGGSQGEDDNEVNCIRAPYSTRGRHTSRQTRASFIHAEDDDAARDRYARETHFSCTPPAMCGRDAPHPRMYNLRSSAGGCVGRGRRDAHTGRTQSHASSATAARLHRHLAGWSGGGRESNDPDRPACALRRRLAAPFAAVATQTQPLLYLNRHTAAVKAIAWNPRQPALLASGGGTDDKTLRFWNTQTGDCVHHVNTHSQVCGLLWSLSGTELVSSHGFSMNQLTIWKYPSMRRVAELHGHTSRVLHLCMSSDGEVVVSAAGDETIRFWRCFPPMPSSSASSSSASASAASLASPPSSVMASPYAGHFFPSAYAYPPHRQSASVRGCGSSSRYDPRGLLHVPHRYTDNTRSSADHNDILPGSTTAVTEPTAASASLLAPAPATSSFSSSSTSSSSSSSSVVLPRDASSAWPHDAESLESDGLSGTATIGPESGDRFAAPTATGAVVHRSPPPHVSPFGGMLYSSYHEPLVSGELPLR